MDGHDHDSYYNNRDFIHVGQETEELYSMSEHYYEEFEWDNLDSVGILEERVN